MPLQLLNSSRGEYNMKSQRRRLKTSSYQINLFLLLLVFSRALSQDPEGPKICPSDKKTIGYYELQTLKDDLDIAIFSADGNGSEARTYILCPETSFTFETLTSQADEEDIEFLDENIEEMFTLEWGLEDVDVEDYDSEDEDFDDISWDFFKESFHGRHLEDTVNIEEITPQDFDTGEEIEGYLEMEDENFVHDLEDLIQLEEADYNAHNDEMIQLANDGGPQLTIPSNTNIQCGEDGSSANQCNFDGGSNRIAVLGDPPGVVIRGVTFTNSVDVPVIQGGTKKTLVDCHWDPRKRLRGG